MAAGPRYRVPFRRRREGKTDYRLRKRLLASGLMRAVVRRTHSHTLVQIVRFDVQGDEVIASASGADLRKMGWKNATSNTPAAYLTGLLAGRRAKKQGIREVVPDLGLQAPSKGGKLSACLLGLRDAGLSIQMGDEIAPSPERVAGTHINQELPKHFEEIKTKVESE